MKYGAIVKILKNTLELEEQVGGTCREHHWEPVGTSKSKFTVLLPLYPAKEKRWPSWVHVELSHWLQMKILFLKLFITIFGLS
jgi:hypothetical protein